MRALVLAALPLLLAACPGGDPGSGPIDGKDSTRELVVGIASDELGALVGSVHFVVKQDGVIVGEETVATPPGASTAVVREVVVRAPVGSRVEAMAEALSPGGGTPVIARSAATTLTREAASIGARKLLRLSLEARCAVFTSSNGSVVGPQCGEGSTCVSGGCFSPEVSPLDLEDYEAGWQLAPPDICRPAKHGPPEIMLGTGQTDYATLDEGQVLQLERGPQGGHHVWVAVRMKNLRQSGSTTAISARLEGDDRPVPSAAFVFTFDRDEGSYCKIWGLRYQVDAGAESQGLAAYGRFLGKRLVLTVDVTDSTGAKATSTRTVQIADKLLCPDGTDACNP